ncbi:MAG: glycosyltransferase family 2 protein [bacterium]|nr:glycosyltransferase family 2 protein [bacterium]
MKLSFVIPAHNEAKNIGLCLQSIINEAKKDGCSDQIEIIVVNNASTDDTKSIASQYSQVRVVDEQRKGLTYARECGFQVTTGELIANVDADNQLTSGWFATVFTEFTNDKNLVALSGPPLYRDLPVWQRGLIQIFFCLTYAIYFITSRVLKVGSVVQGGNFVVRRSALQTIGGFDTTIKFYGEDTDIARRLFKVGKVKYTFALPIYSSGRRLAAEGIFTIAWRYSLNYLWTIFSKKPLTDDYLDIR